MISKPALKRINYKDFDLDMTKPINKSGSNEVYLSKVNSQVAAKKVVCVGVEKKTRMQNQIHVLADLAHPNIVEIVGYDIVELDETVTVYYLFMEKAQSSLKEFMMAKENRDYFKNIDNFVIFMLQMINAGVYLETMKISCGDITPENILIFDNSLYKLEGTGFAKEIDSPESVNMSLETMIYKAPEIVKDYVNLGQKLNFHQCDIYAMGIVLLEVAGISCSKLAEFNLIDDEMLRTQRFNEFKATSPEILEVLYTSSQLLMMVQLKPENRFHFSVVVGNLMNCVHLPDKYWLKYYEITGKLFEKAADQGNAVCQYNLGMMYDYGNGVEQSNEKAVQWYEKAADQGNGPAQNNLGVMYQNGQGVEKNYEKAMQWYKKAADQGNALAHNNLGWIYHNGQGVEKNYEEAVQWYQKAADQGFAWSQETLGLMYIYGQGVAQNSEKALQWFQKGANQGFASAQCDLGVMYEHGDGVKQSFEKAVQWYQKAADQGHALGQYNLGVMYQNGQGVERSYEKAVQWYQKAADQGNVLAQCNLGAMYEHGNGVEQSFEKAVPWYQKAADQGYALAQCNLALMFKKGQGVQQSYEEALQWFQKSADQGSAAAQYNLGEMHAHGKGVEQSHEKAVQWYLKAADQGNALAQNALGEIYYVGCSVEQSYEKAVQWYQKAAYQGQAMAQYNLALMYKKGQGVEQSYEEAVYWLHKAANQENLDAQCELGCMYYYGLGAERNYDIAAQWFLDLCTKMSGGSERAVRKRVGEVKNKMIKGIPELRIIWDLSVKLSKELRKAKGKLCSRTKSRFIQGAQTKIRVD